LFNSFFKETRIFGEKGREMLPCKKGRGKKNKERGERSRERGK